MSFSFRNLFSQDESGSSGESDSSREAGATDGRASFLPDGTTSAFQGARDGGQAASETSGSGGARFMINELLPFIPPAIAAPSGIPMEQMVEIPLPADGSRDVKLSTIYQLCPNLFASEITPLNDSVVTLPPRLGDSAPAGAAPSGPGGGPEARKANPFADTGANPSPGFSQPANNAVPPAGGSSDNPFWSPEPEKNTPAEPVAEKPAPQSPAGGNSPFGMSKPPAQTGSPAPAAPGTGPSGQAEKKESAPQGFMPPSGEQSSSFNAFQPAAPPEKKEENAPTPQANPFGDFGSAKTPDPIGNQPPIPPSESGFSTLFSQKAEQDASIGSPEVPSEQTPGHPSGFGSGPAPETPMQPVSGFGASSVEGGTGGPEHNAFGGTPAMPANTDHDVDDEDDGEFEGYLPPEIDEDSLSKIPGLMEAEEREKEALSPVSDEPVHFDDLISSDGDKQSGPPPMSFFDELSSSGSEDETPEKQSFQAEPSPAAAPSHIEATSKAPEPSPNFGEPVKKEPAQAPAVEPAGMPNFSSSNSMRDLELRAVFGIEEAFTHQKVANLVADMAGIDFCSISAPNGSAKAGQDEAAISQDGAREMAKNVRQLAEFSGIKDASTFTLQTNQGMVSIFLEGDSCLTVRHSNSVFGPGVRERLILVARSLDRLEG